MYDYEVNDYAPVLVTGFNRPEFLEDQIQYLLRMGCKVYVSLDIPEPGDSNNREPSRRCKSLVEYYSNELAAVRISTKNLGCYRGVTEAITWAFGKEESIIILEDDVRVNEAFLLFATTMLQVFEENKSVGSIAGANFVPKSHLTHIDEQVRFSAFTSSWGWATWRNRWQDYLTDIDTFPILDFTFPENFWGYMSKKYWVKIFEDTKNGKYDAWDYRWLYSNWKRKRLTLVPNANLVLNIGFGAGATHTQDSKLPWWLPREIDQSFQVRDIQKIALRDTRADHWMKENHFRMKLNQQLRASFSRQFPQTAHLYRKLLEKISE